MIDLHCHLDGAITVPIAKKLAALQNITLPTTDDNQLAALLSVPDSCTSLTDFLKCFALPGSLLQTPEAITEAVRLVRKDMEAQGLIYLELRFAPQLHCQKGLSQEEVLKAALSGLDSSGVHTNLILCCMRGDKTKNPALESANLETINLAKKYLVQDGGVVAVDLAGAEALFPTRNFAKEFELAHSLNIPITIHAGEADGPESVWDALRFGATRIGHGIRSIEDEKLISYIVENNITLEMAPTSNRQTRAVENMKKYPLSAFIEKGVKVTINTDDPAICRTNLRKEFQYIAKNYGIRDNLEKVLLVNAAKAAFTTVEIKQQLIDKIEKNYNV